MIEAILKFIADYRLGDIASLLGLLVSVIGFIITILGVYRSKRAAEAAAESAKNVREEISRLDTMLDFSAAITIMEEIKRLHRTGAWQLLPDRYSTLRQKLILIRGVNTNLAEVHLAALQNAIQQFSDMERRIERALQSETNPPKVAKLNEIVSIQIDKLSEVLTAIRQETGTEIYGRQKIGNADSTITRKN